jgi:hypothetical protein
MVSMYECGSVKLVMCNSMIRKLVSDDPIDAQTPNVVFSIARSSRQKLLIKGLLAF